MRRFVLLCVCFALLVPPSIFAQETPNFRPFVMPASKTNYAADRILVKFKEGQSKRDLQKQVVVREAERATVFGNFRQKTSDLLKLGQKTPEEKLAGIEQTEEVIGVEAQMLAADSDIAVVKSTATIDVPRAVEEFKKLPEVEVAEPDYLIYGLASPNDTYLFQQWNMYEIGADKAWDRTTGDSTGAIRIAILDSGVSSNHEDIGSKVLSRYDCRGTVCLSNQGQDDQGHGTIVGGIASALTNNQKGMAGMGYNTKLVSYKVLEADPLNPNATTGYTSWIITALDHLRNNASGQKIVINISIGSSDQSSIFQSAIDNAWNAGFVIVAAAGNNGSTAKIYPAGFTNTIAVGAIQNGRTKAPYSNNGPSWVDVAAPGGYCTEPNASLACIFSTSYKFNSSNYVYVMGTSFAAPHVSGLAALVWHVFPSYTNAQVRSAIETTSDPVSLVFWKYGIINAARAVGVAPTLTSTPTSAPTRTPTSTPSTIGFSIDRTTVDVTLYPGTTPSLFTITPLRTGGVPFEANNNNRYPFGSLELILSPTSGVLDTQPRTFTLSASPAATLGTYTGSVVVIDTISNQSVQVSITARVVDRPTNTPTPTATPTEPTTTPTLKSGDVDGNNIVNLTDLSTLLANYGRSGRTRQQGDVAGNDSFVNLADLSAVLSNFGN